jgi:osmotically-inducible protein OsmY
MFADAQTRRMQGTKLAARQQPGTSTMKTDSQLQQDVSAELEWEPSVHAARIGVEVKDGVVTLAGQVDSYAEKWNAERAAQRVSGVKAMTTELKVHLTSLSQRTDGDIAESVENVLEWSSALPAGAIRVMVEGGWVTLSGDVDWQYQRQAATDSVRYLLGVTGVSDQIGIKPSVAGTAVKSDIEAALRRTSIADARKISVAVQGSDVTLSGTVKSWDERDTATNSAWGTPGVRNVIDKMTLAF